MLDVNPDVISAAILIVQDMSDSAGRFARDCDRLADLLRAGLPSPPNGDVELHLVPPDESGPSGSSCMRPATASAHTANRNNTPPADVIQIWDASSANATA